jgi:hypothetical protein
MTNYYKVHIGGRRNRYFRTLADATTFCSAVFAQTRIVLSIVEVKQN